MSEVKSQRKADVGSKAPETKKTEVKKTEVKKPEAAQSPTASEPPSADNSAGKTDATPKSASQSSISHFSSVSTPAYRSGWNSIFGGGTVSKKTKSNTRITDELPIHVKDCR